MSESNNAAVNMQAGVFGFENVSVTSDKKFKPRAEFNNLCLGRLVSVEIKETTTPAIDEKGIASTYEYAGVPVPTIVFRYKEEPTAEDKTERFYTDNFRIVTTKKSDGSAISLKNFGSILMEAYRHCRHRLDAYVNLPNYVDAGFPKPIDMNADINTRIEQWRAFCQFFVDAFNKGKDGNPVFIGADGESALVWIKLTAHYNDRKYLCAPGFVGEGYIELYREGIAPAIELKPGETIELADGADEAKAGTTAAAEAGTTMGYGAVPGAVPMTAEKLAEIQNRYANKAGGTPKY